MRIPVVVLTCVAGTGSARQRAVASSRALGAGRRGPRAGLAGVGTGYKRDIREIYV